jgi:molybdenum ABC transporter molybdate-binding protein
MKALIKLCILLCLPLTASAGEVRIHSNGNLKPILMEISHYYQIRNPGSKVVIETGKIAEIKERLEAKAAADLLIGDEKLFETVAETNVLDKGSQRVLFTDPVIAVADIDSDIELTDPKEINAENFKKIALLGEKNALGKQVRAYLEPKGLKELPAEKKVEVADIKAALESIKLGEAKWTFVYSSDASRKRLKHLFQVPGTDIPEVSFSVALVKYSQNKDEASKFIEAMQSTIGKKFFENAGFVLPGSSKQALNLSQTKPAKQGSAQTQTQTQTSPQTQASTEPQTQTQTQVKQEEKTKKQKKDQKADDPKKKKKKKKDKDKD